MGMRLDVKWSFCWLQRHGRLKVVADDYVAQALTHTVLAYFQALHAVYLFNVLLIATNCTTN